MVLTGAVEVAATGPEFSLHTEHHMDFSQVVVSLISKSVYLNFEPDSQASMGSIC